MGKYRIGRGYRRSRRWPYVLVPVVLLIFATYTLSSSLFGGGQGDNLASQPTLSAQDAERADVLKKIELTAQLPWPDYGQAAFGAARGGVVVRSDNADQPVPIASLAKVITALAVLDKKPLQPGEQGPLITLTEQDEANYWEYVRKQGSVTPVKAGVQVSQYQAMQAMLLPSSNNMADALVVWAFGSMDNYVSYANNMVKELGFSKTTVADASGYSPLTKSTAAEMVGLGFLFIDNPVLQDIAKQPEADIPFAGKIHNYNDGINNDGILGLKVGFTDEAGKTFLAADFPGTGRDDISLAVVLGAADWQTLLNDTKTLLLSGKEEYKRAESS